MPICCHKRVTDMDCSLIANKIVDFMKKASSGSLIFKVNLEIAHDNVD